MNKTIGIVIPNYNKELELAECVNLLLRELNEFNYNFKLIIVDDCSTDNSKIVIEKLVSIEGVSVIYLDTNQGKGAALRCGFNRLVLETEVIAYTDADLDLDVRPLLIMIQSILDGEVDVAVGSKVHANSQVDYPKTRRILSFIFSIFVRWAIKINVKDTQSGQKAFSTIVIRDVLPFTNLDGFAFDAELLALTVQGGYSIEEFPVILKYKFSSSVGFRSGLRALLDLWSVRLSIKSYRKMHF